MKPEQASKVTTRMPTLRPFGEGLSKTWLGDQPLKLALDSYYNAIRPNAGNDTWLLQATLTFIFPVPGSSGSRP